MLGSPALADCIALGMPFSDSPKADIVIAAVAARHASGDIIRFRMRKLHLMASSDMWEDMAGLDAPTATTEDGLPLVTVPFDAAAIKIVLEIINTTEEMQGYCFEDLLDAYRVASAWSAPRPLRVLRDMLRQVFVVFVLRADSRAGPTERTQPCGL
jgi:hypothetical protein